MKSDLKNKVVSVGFMLIITGVMLANIIAPDRELSFSERRRLEGPPDFTMTRLFSGELFVEFERYSLDQFVLRDEFRSLKAFFGYKVLAQKDNNGIYLVGDGIYKMEHPLNERATYNAARKLNEVYDLYLEGMNVHYAIIPDKNYFVARQNGYLSMDYGRMIEILSQEVRHMNYIDLFRALSISDFYLTDIHWRQDRILPVANMLLTQMGADGFGAEYTERQMYPFYGSYYGQAALRLPPESIMYLTNEVLENAVVYDYELKSYGRVYAPELFDGMNGYDIFLSGAKPLIYVENPICTSGRELILFRDSFGSSIAPLMLAGYSKIIIVDLRYITTKLLADYIDFSPHQDVLFLYSAQVINNSWMLR